jgi:butyryl-CoA dehydrogenase
MNMELTTEQRDMLAVVRQFVNTEVAPYASDPDHRGEFPTAMVERLKAMGLFGITIPEEYGGLGLDLVTYALVVKELSRGWISLSGIVNTHFMAA